MDDLRKLTKPVVDGIEGAVGRSISSNDGGGLPNAEDALYGHTHLQVMVESDAIKANAPVAPVPTF